VVGCCFYLFFQLWCFWVKCAFLFFGSLAVSWAQQVRQLISRLVSQSVLHSVCQSICLSVSRMSRGSSRHVILCILLIRSAPELSSSVCVRTSLIGISPYKQQLLVTSFRKPLGTWLTFVATMRGSTKKNKLTHKLSA